MSALEKSDLLQACNLPQAWAGHHGWRLLDTAFCQGLEFLKTWHAWKSDPLRPKLLHYVAFSQGPSTSDVLLEAAATSPALWPLAQELIAQWRGVSSGFHRLTFEQGHVLLTLCVGEVNAMLRDQQFDADTVFLGIDDQQADGTSHWDIWTVKALARCCRRGTRIVTTPEANKLLADLVQCGFEFDANTVAPDSTSTALGQCGVFNPRWTIKNTRDALPSPVSSPGTCVVIGAGLAGASVAASLARRGWQVQVLDRAEAPASGASGLPVGLVVPHVSVDDCALSRLSRSGVRLMLHQAKEFLNEGQDWRNSGVLERRMDGSPGPSEIWHSPAAWLKPGQMVRAWLASPGITFLGKTQVSALRPSEAGWLVFNEFDEVVAQAQRVVFANAMGSLPLIQRLYADQPELSPFIGQIPLMQGVRGQLTWAMHHDEDVPFFPGYPINGSGSVIPSVPVEDGFAWFVGSSYQPESQSESAAHENHLANLERLNKILPELANMLAPQFQASSVNAWKNTRCVTSDRLPVVGPLDAPGRSGLWICAGMGSRGLTFSMLCAELLAASWAGEPLPIGASLARTLSALRSTKVRHPPSGASD